jgi:hypothetical protein
MPSVWGGQDIDREKTVFVWPSGTARAEKTDMHNITFKPGMSEKQVKTMLTREFDLDCDADDILGLVDGYSQLCECLGDIAGNRKGYHIRFRDERSVELSQLRKENAELKKQIQAAGGSSGSSDAAELRRLRNENDKLHEENAKLKKQLQGGGSSSAAGRGSSDRASNSSAAEPVQRGGASDTRRGSRDEPKGSTRRGSSDLADRSAKLMPAAKPAAKPKKSSGAAAECQAQGDRVQDLGLPHPRDTSTGCENYERLKEHWLQGCEDEELPPPDDLEDHIDDLILAEKPKYVREAVPLSCLIDALADQWMRDNVL